MVLVNGAGLRTSCNGESQEAFSGPGGPSAFLTVWEEFHTAAPVFLSDDERLQTVLCDFSLRLFKS